MAQDSSSSDILQVQIGIINNSNGLVVNHEENKTSFSTDTLLSSVQSTDFSPNFGGEDSRSTSAASSSATKNLDHPTVAAIEEVDDVLNEQNRQQGSDNTVIINGATSNNNNNNIMTTSATSSTSNSGHSGGAGRFNTITPPSRRMDSCSSSSSRSKYTPNSQTLGRSPLARDTIEDQNANNSNINDLEVMSPQRIEDRLNAVKAARERQEAERARRLAELAEALRIQQSSYEQRRAEIRRMMEERRQREDEHRRAVEERRRRLFEAEQAKREAILRKLEEREIKIRETRIRSAQIIGGDGTSAGSVFCMTSSTCTSSAQQPSSSAARALADSHRAYSIASLRRPDGARSASCDRHGAVVTTSNSSGQQLLEKSPHRQSSTALSSGRGGSSGIIGTSPNGVMSVSMICLSPSEKPSTTTTTAPSSTTTSNHLQTPSSSTAAGRTISSANSTSRRSRKQQAESSASHASLLQIGEGENSIMACSPAATNARMCASLVNIPEDEPIMGIGVGGTFSQKNRLHNQQHRAPIDTSSSASRRRLLASRASMVTWQQTSRRSGKQTTTTIATSSSSSRYQPRPSSVPARPRIRRDGPTMFQGAAEVVPAPPAPYIRHHLNSANNNANGGASEMTLTASVTAAIVPPQAPINVTSASSSRTSSLRAKSERHLNRLSAVPSPVLSQNGDVPVPERIKKPLRPSLAPPQPPKPATPSAARAHPPTKQALLPSSTPLANGSGGRGSMAPVPQQSGDRADSSLDADAEREYQRKLTEKRRQAREAAAAKAAKAAEEKLVVVTSPTNGSPGNDTENASTAATTAVAKARELTVTDSSVMARSAPPDIIANALDGDGVSSSAASTTSESPQPQLTAINQQQPSPATTTSPESAIVISEPASSEDPSDVVIVAPPAPPVINRDTTIVVSPPVIVTGADSMMLGDDDKKRPLIINGDMPSSTESSSIGSTSASQTSSAAVSPPVSSGVESGTGTSEPKPEPPEPTPPPVVSSSEPVKPTAPAEQSAPQNQRLPLDTISAVRERLSSLTGSQSNLMTTSLTTLASAASTKPVVDDWAKKQEEERAERKKRLDAIMSRVKPSVAANTPNGSSNSNSSTQPQLLSGPIQSLPTFGGIQSSSSDNNAAGSATALSESATSVNGSTPSSYTVPSADILLSKIKSEKVQSILANRLAASSGSKVRFNLGREEDSNTPPSLAIANGIGSSVPDLQASQSPLPSRLAPSNSSTASSSTNQQQMPTTALLMLSSSSNSNSTSNGNDDVIVEDLTKIITNGSITTTTSQTNGRHRPAQVDADDEEDTEDSGNEDRKLEEVIRLAADATPASSQPKQQPSVEAFVN